MQPFCPLKSYHQPLHPAFLRSRTPRLPSSCSRSLLACSPSFVMAASRSPKVVRQAAAATCVVDDNTTFVQADPATFRALVQKLTGAAPAAAAGGTTAAAEKLPAKPQEDEAAAVTIAHAPPPPPPPPRRPKLQERRRAAPARLELARPQLPSSSSSFYYYHHHAHAHAHHHSAHGLMHSPVSPMDAYLVLAAASASPSLSSSSSMTPSPHSSSPSCGGAGVVMISREEEEREEKAIASKSFYLHASPRAGDGDRPKLLPLFPVHSPRINELRRA
ncbi:hypothetical protein BDA96_06G261800 [Sorghum bicolor]|uniref:VQ domain-containing protein n=2 Tax=Sorghum bicolor TaxID=4558 RepID=A0A921QV17_SORBI|nr:VQ motif-containing protein 11-like [Sorghum bicolor]KAG0527765.1 hypothetical protein BDA96_06G261800 [Sorghum bicolor]OQU82436.1 hypothetical protein SORBI_3006G239100 [Sorghum bicolor]|eukprot:XP_021318483.1 VQ motif-containing protein 11-like [Sorghum bicolor]